MTTDPTLDNLTVGLAIPADPGIGSPAGVVTAVEHVTCDDHGAEGARTGWQRHCYYCGVAWEIDFDGGIHRRVMLNNEYLWTDADRAWWEQTRATPRPEPADYDPFSDF